MIKMCKNRYSGYIFIKKSTNYCQLIKISDLKQFILTFDKSNEKNRN